MGGSDDLEGEHEEIRERKRERLKGELSGDADTAGPEGAEAPTTPVHVEDREHLDSLAADHDVVLVDFYADWCGPCKMLEPIVESIADDTPAVVAKVDIDAHQVLARDANVRGVPTLVLYAGGDVVERLVGVQDEDRLRSLVEEHATG